MKILLASLNAKYIHTNLALRYLYEYADIYKQYIDIKEYTINHDVDYIYSEMMRGEYDVICFSCYIWNISKVMSLAANIKKVRTETVIVLGGPEVSYDSKAFLEKHSFVDYLIRGEGEKTFTELLDFLVHGKGNIDDIKGLSFISGNKIIETVSREPISDMDELPFPYKSFLPLKDKIIYYETSRGCPFYCTYCLSSIERSVRYFSLERVKKDLDLFIEEGVPQVKLVDRTFNLMPDRCLEIMRYIQEKDKGITNFHFEMNGDLLDDEMLTFLRSVRKGMFQFEIGVQSTCEESLDAVKRKMNFEKLKENVQSLESYGNIHIHLDLIAGLPYESYETFKKSFNDVYALKPHNLQLGFLKLLKGSPLRNDCLKHEYIFREEEPYEVLSNKYLSADELIKLKMIEDILEKYYNRPGFRGSLHYISENYNGRYFAFFEGFTSYWYKNEYQHISHSKEALYEILLSYYREKERNNTEIFEEILLYDKLRITFRQRREDDENISLKIHEVLHDTEFRNYFMPHYNNLKAKEVKKNLGHQLFHYNIHEYVYENKELEPKMNLCLFDYGNKDVFGQAAVYCIDDINILMEDNQID